MDDKTTKRPRGFAAMSPEKQRELAARGGRAAHVLGRGHEWDREEARAAGSRGGKASRGGRGKLPVPESMPETTPGPAPGPVADDAEQPSR